MHNFDHIFQTRVSFYDTDAMGVMHHSAHLKKFEDARVDWLRQKGLDRYHYPQADMVLAVVSAQLKYHKPCKYEQELNIHLKFVKSRLKLVIEYAMYNPENELLAVGETIHVPVNKNLKLTTYPEPMLAYFNKESI